MGVQLKACLGGHVVTDEQQKHENIRNQLDEKSLRNPFDCGTCAVGIG